MLSEYQGERRRCEGCLFPAGFVHLPTRTFHCGRPANETRFTSPRCSAPDMTIVPPELPRCPKCQGQEIVWEETFDAGRVHRQTAAAGIDPDGMEIHGPAAIRLTGRCEGCDHSWKPRDGLGRYIKRAADLPGYAPPKERD